MPNRHRSRSTLGRDIGLVLWQIRYEQRSYWRNRGRGIFTFAFPIMFLVIFASIDKGAHISTRGGIPYDDFFVPGILAYGVIATTFVNLAIGTAILRDEGVLKRMQGTPLPRWAYVVARIGSASLVMVAMTVVVLVLGVAVWGLHFRAGALPGLVLTLLLGTAAFTTLGIGITGSCPPPTPPGRRQPGHPAADVHLQHLVSDRFAAARAEVDRRPVPDQGPGRWPPVGVRPPVPRQRAQRARPAGARDLDGDRHRMMVRFLRVPQGELA